MRRLLFLQINEFNRQLLAEAADLWDLSAVRRVLSLRESATTTDDVYDDGSLEPWVQWVSVHTGTPYARHRVLHIGDLPGREHPQLWETLSERGVTSGVWGAMNATRRGAPRCLFFVPDPWAFSERTHPESLNGLIALPRFLAKNRLSILHPELASTGASLVGAALSEQLVRTALRQAGPVLSQMRRDPAKAYTYFTAFEHVSASRFCAYRARHRPAFSVLFLNMVAHAQHYYWDDVPLADNARLAYVLAYLDRTLAMVLAGLEPGEQLLVANGFTQRHVARETPAWIYRPKDHPTLLRALDVRSTGVDAHMTNDAHLFFPDAAAARAGRAVLEGVRVHGEPLFQVESYPGEPRLFYRVAYRGDVGPRDTFEAAGRVLPFHDYFGVLGRHTGTHGPEGTVLTTLEGLPARMPNHRLHDVVLDYFAGEDLARSLPPSA